MIFKGFRFGLILQIAIGPVCMYIIMTALKSGILAAETGALAATLVDSIFVSLAILGIGSLLSKQKMKLFLKYFGTVISLYFGIGIILGTLGINIIPSFGSSSLSSVTSNAFITTLILTAANPLSILFWAGVFSSRVVEEGYGRREMLLFGSGAVLSTLVSLGLVAFIIGLVHVFIPEIVITILNLIVGAVIIGFGLKLAFSKISPATNDKAL